jgi:citrate synthase
MATAGTVVDRGLEGVVVGSTAVSHVEGEAGRLSYRGFDIDDLAANATFEEACYLLLFGTLPNAHQLDDITVRIAASRALPAPLLDWMQTMPRDAWPLDVLRTAVSALALFVPHAGDGAYASSPRAAIGLIAKAPTIVAAWNRIRRGLRPLDPLPNLSTAANALYMRTGRAPSPEAERALDLYLVLLADHSYNPATFAARVTASTRAGIYAAVTSALAALDGELHGGAPAKVMRALTEIGSPEAAAAFAHAALERGEPLAGVGHRIYEARDPRAGHLEAAARELAALADPRWFAIARALEDAAREATVKRRPAERAFANVSFYTAPLLFALGIPADEFTCTFACARMAGWTAHILEQLADNRLIGPQVSYAGPAVTSWVPLARRGRP